MAVVGYLTKLQLISGPIDHMGPKGMDPYVMYGGNEKGGSDPDPPFLKQLADAGHRARTNRLVQRLPLASRTIV